MQIIKLLNEIQSGNLTYTSLSNKNKVRLESIMEAKTKGITKSEMKKWIKINTEIDSKTPNITFNDDGCEILNSCKIHDIPPFKIKFKSNHLYIKIPNIENLDWMNIIDIGKVTSLDISSLAQLSDISYLDKSGFNGSLNLAFLPQLTQLNIPQMKLRGLHIQDVSIDDFSGLPQEISDFCVIIDCKKLSTFRGMEKLVCTKVSIDKCEKISNLKFTSPSVKVFLIQNCPLKSLKGLTINSADNIGDTLWQYEKKYPSLKWSDIKFNISRDDLEDYKFSLHKVIYYLYYLIGDIKDGEKSFISFLIKDEYTYSKEFRDMIKDDTEGLM